MTLVFAYIKVVSGICFRCHIAGVEDSVSACGKAKIRGIRSYRDAAKWRRVRNAQPYTVRFRSSKELQIPFKYTKKGCGMFRPIMLLNKQCMLILCEPHVRGTVGAFPRPRSCTVHFQPISSMHEEKTPATLMQ